MFLTTRIFLLLLFVGAAQADDAEQQYKRLAGQAQSDECLRVAVDLDAGEGLAVSDEGAGSELRYRMAMNNVAEGWSWQPGANPAEEDYYRFKYLPLQTTLEARGEYAAEDKIGTVQSMAVSWRYDYFLAFDNLYDFFPRLPDDDAGFVAHLATRVSGPVAMRARACLVSPVTSESTTFWKAMHARPTDFTLKKRYLVGRLQSVEFVDQASGRVLAVVAPVAGK